MKQKTIKQKGKIKMSYTSKVIQNDLSVNETPEPDDVSPGAVAELISTQIHDELQSMENEIGSPDRITIITTITRD